MATTRPRRAHALTSLATIALLSLSGVAAAGATSALPAVVLDAGGKPLAGVLVTARVLVDGPGEEIRTVELGRGTTTSTGLASIAVPRRLPHPTLDDADSVSVEFSGPAGLLYEVLYVPPEASGTGDWELDPANGVAASVEPAPDARTAGDEAKRSTARADGAEAAGPSHPARFRQTADGPAPVLLASGEPEGPGGLSSAGNPYAWCVARDPLASVRWQPMDIHAKRLIPVKRVRTQHRARMVHEWDTTRGTTLETMVAARDGSRATGGMSYSSLQRSGVGFRHEFANRRHKIVKMQWQYRKFRAMCYRPESDRPFADSGWRKWRPRKFTGQTRLVNPPNQGFHCQHVNRTFHETRATWTVNRRATAWSGWFGIGGVSLRVVQRNSTTERITLVKDRDARRVYACGSNDFFVHAARGREILPY